MSSRASPPPRTARWRAPPRGDGSTGPAAGRVRAPTSGRSRPRDRLSLSGSAGLSERRNPAGTRRRSPGVYSSLAQYTGTPPGVGGERRRIRRWTGGTALKLLVLNSGSSSIKYRLFRMESMEVLRAGVVDRIGEPGPSAV
ncbi:MAG: hypothetical protein ACXWWW_11275, partial [Candidatus Deferrimicrobiaceae bacterium]